MPQDLDVGALRGFATAVRTGSMGRAAEALERTQPAISQQLRRLEDVLGCRLLRRTAQGVVMTAEGEAFLPLAERILALNDEAQVHVRGRASVTVQRRRIGIIEDVAANGLQMALADFVQVHPELELDVMVAGGEAMREAFGTGSIMCARWSGWPPRRLIQLGARYCRWCFSVIHASGGCGRCKLSINWDDVGARPSRVAA
jgi:DNA-binding transcriptional LysR family regulator